MPDLTRRGAAVHTKQIGRHHFQAHALQLHDVVFHRLRRVLRGNAPGPPENGRVLTTHTSISRPRVRPQCRSSAAA